MIKNIIFLFLLSVPINFYAQEILTGTAISISDGDTFTILDANKKTFKIRLYGIDCPESGQPYGKQAKKYVSECVFKAFVKVIKRDVDRYGRTVGEVFYNDSVNLNIELLQVGLAWHYKYFDSTLSYSQAEQLAKKEKIGL